MKKPILLGIAILASSAVLNSSELSEESFLPKTTREASAWIDLHYGGLCRALEALPAMYAAATKASRGYDDFSLGYWSRDKRELLKKASPAEKRRLNNEFLSELRHLSTVNATERDNLSRLVFALQLLKNEKQYADTLKDFNRFRYIVD